MRPRRFEAHDLHAAQLQDRRVVPPAAVKLRHSIVLVLRSLTQFHAKLETVPRRVRMPSGEFSRIMKGLASIGDTVVISVTKASPATEEQELVGVYANHSSRLVRLLPVLSLAEANFSLRQFMVASPPAV